MPLEQKQERERVAEILARYKQLETKKQPWLPMFQELHKYVMSRSADFTNGQTSGEFLTEDIFDSTAPMSAHRLACSLVGALWPGGGKTFKLRPPLRGLSKAVMGSEKVKAFYDALSVVAQYTFDHYESGFSNAMEEYTHDLVGFGTSGVGAFEVDELDPDSEVIDVRFRAVNVKQMAIDTDFTGRVDTVWIRREITVRQLVQEYGIDFVSEKSREAYNNNRMEDKVKIIHGIEPRQDTKGGFGAIDMPIASIHIEEDAHHIIKESGYESMAVIVSYFWKLVDETYGRCPGSECMPDIHEANDLTEGLSIATEKYLEPPLIHNNDGAIPGGIIRQGAGQITVRHVSGRVNDSNRAAVEPLYTVGEPNTSYNRLEKIVQTIERNFYIDLMTDLNNEQRMTAFETNVRDQLRQQALVMIFTRQIVGFLIPLINRVMNILLRKKRLGFVEESPAALQASEKGDDTLIIPKEVFDLMMSGREWYRVDFISPAARALKAEELKGAQALVTVAAELGKIDPSVLKNVKIDKLFRYIAELSGGPLDAIRSEEEREAISKMEGEQAARQQAMITDAQSSEVMKTKAQAAQAATKAGIPLEALAPQQG